MAKVTYAPQGDVGDNGETRQAGYTFKKGQSVEVMDGPALEKFKANPHFTVAGAKEAKQAKDDRNLEPAPTPPPSIANQVYPNQPPGVGEKTASIPRPEGSLEGAIEAAGGDIKRAAKTAQETADRTAAQVETLERAQKASEPKAPRKSASKSASKKSSRRK